MLHIRENTRIQKPDANATHGYVLRNPKTKEERGECEMFRLALGILLIGYWKVIILDI